MAAFGVPNIPLHTSLTSPWRQSQWLACVETGHLPNLRFLGNKIINSDHSGLWHKQKMAQNRFMRRGCHPDLKSERSTLINLQFASWLENSFEPFSSNMFQLSNPAGNVLFNLSTCTLQLITDYCMSWRHCYDLNQQVLSKTFAFICLQHVNTSSNSEYVYQQRQQNPKNK